MNLFHHKDLGNHLLQLCPKVVKHPVYVIHFTPCILPDPTGVEHHGRLTEHTYYVKQITFLCTLSSKNILFIQNCKK